MPKLFENIPKSVLCVTQRRPLVPGTWSSSHTSFRASGGGRAGLTGVRGQHRFPSPHPRGPCQAEHKDLWDGDVHSLSLSPCTEGLEESSTPSKPRGRSCTFLTAFGDTQQRRGRGALTGTGPCLEGPRLVPFSGDLFSSIFWKPQVRDLR